jgi:hypothetical protein
MNQIVEIRALENGLWEIQILRKEGETEVVERGKRCRI